MGAALLGLVTTGLYDDPMSIYREYIQNAADAATGLSAPERGRVDIEIDVAKRRLRIRDNGPGLSREEAIECLVPIGRSSKKLGIDRGFRGIGRLAGLAFAKTVSLTTRACKNQMVARITWQSDRLPDLTSLETELHQAILDCIHIELLPGSEYPDHFFEVEISDVARHSAGLLLNRDSVRDYIGEVCPVPMSSKFPFAENVERLFDGTQMPLTLEIMLEGDPDPVERPYGTSVSYSGTKEGAFTNFQMVRVPSVDGHGEAAIGWIAHSSYLGAIPKHQRIRGVRARVGNVQIGDETVFDHLFTEERFNRWCVGEVHIVDHRLVPNARRDYFEPGPHLRNLENHLIPILQKIGSRCRTASTARNRARRTLSELTSLKDAHDLAISGYLPHTDASALAQEALQELPRIRESILTLQLGTEHFELIDGIQRNLLELHTNPYPQPLNDLQPAHRQVYRQVFQALAKAASSPRAARDLIAAVIKQTSDTQSNSQEKAL